MARGRAFLAGMVCWLMLVTAAPAGAAPGVVTNGSTFTDTSGALLHAHGGGVIEVGGFFYLFGENRNPDDTFRAVSVYRSTDLVRWEFRNDVLTQESAAELAVAKIERPKVIYNAATDRFVLWMHWENGTDYTQARTAVAVSSTVDGDYTYNGSFRPLGYDSRDMTVYRDDDGTAYLISATRVNADLNIYRLTSDYTGVESLVRTLWPGSYREAPAVFRRDGTYFLVTSGATSWNPNQARYAVASSIDGAWSELRDLGDAITYGSQPTFVLPVAGTSTTSYLYLGDRWAGAWGGPVNDSEYVWLPLEFPSPTSLSLTWSPQVSIDTATGEVSGVGAGRPYSAVVARHSDRCLDLSASSTQVGAPVQQWGCNGGANQAWQLRPLPGGDVTLLARHSHLCLTASATSTAVVQSTCDGGDGQRFAVEDVGGGAVRILARLGGGCLDVAGGSPADGARLLQWPCSGATNQQFSLRGL